jgi:anti-anti-sigma factor
MIMAVPNTASSEHSLVIEETTSLSGVTISLAGELDAQSVGSLREALSSVDFDGIRRLTIRCADLTFLDSVGIQVLVEGYVEADRNGVEFRVTEIGPFQYRVLEVTQLLDTLQVTGREGEETEPDPMI